MGCTSRSVPSKYYFFRTYASAMRIFFVKSHISPLFSSPYPFTSPFVCHLPAPYLHWNLIGTSLESHWNLIGISPNDERIIKQLPTIFIYNSSTTLDGIPSRVSRLPNTLDLLSSISQGTSLSIIPNVFGISPPLHLTLYTRKIAPKCDFSCTYQKKTLPLQRKGRNKLIFV